MTCTSIDGNGLKRCGRLAGHSGNHRSADGYIWYSPPLSFSELREANSLRLPQFKNKHGELAHWKPDGSDWTRADWLEAVVGELGEYANMSKKLRRGDLTEKEFKEAAAKELADVVTYLDILAMQLGINLGEAVRSKFNEVSKRVGAEVWL